jgi:hypothetical protein
MDSHSPFKVGLRSVTSAERPVGGARYLLRYGSGEWVEVDVILYEAALREMAEDPVAAGGVEAVIIPSH